MAALERYARQMKLAALGSEGQRQLAAGSVLIVGCGGLGGHLAVALARAGVGRLRIVDDDRVQLVDLHRQVLFDEADAAAGAPKVEAASRLLGRINSTIDVETMAERLDAGNVARLLEGVDVALDGSDSFAARELLNGACLARGKPWVFGGVVGAAGMAMAILPGRGPCFSCVFPRPPTEELPSSESAGILGTAPAAIAAIQATEAIKIIRGGAAAVAPGRLVSIDLWRGLYRTTAIDLRDGCAACGGKGQR